jgi:hypothetical protein
MTEQYDTAKLIKLALSDAWELPHNGWTVTLHVDDDLRPSDENPVLLVADDGGPALLGGAWLLRKMPRRPTLRITSFAKGRNTARTVVAEAADWIIANHAVAHVARIEDVSDPLIARDRATGAYLASITMPVVVRPKTTPD